MPKKKQTETPEEIKSERDELQKLFDRHWTINKKAIKRWQKAHPGNSMVWPDQTKMVEWLMDERDRLEAKWKKAVAIRSKGK